MSEELERLANSQIRNKQEEAARNRQEFPLTRELKDMFDEANPIKEREHNGQMVPAKSRVVYTIENGKQLGKPDQYSLAPDDPRWTK